MKLPRDVSGDQVVRVLVRLGYEVIRQKGSHIRLRHDGPPAHFLTVPNHPALKTGMLHGILADVSRARAISIEILVGML
jgi:predicted RNA binding protein YcfA (HicA-like mRNA interferase family)